MKKLFTIIALMTMFLGASAVEIVDAEIDFSKYSNISEVRFYGWGASESARARLSIQNGCLHFHSDEATDPSWDCQFHPIGDVDAKVGVTYTLHFKIKGSVAQNCSMLGFGQTPYGKFQITTDWVEGVFDYECTEANGNLLMQCGDYIGDFDIAYLKVTHEGKNEVYSDKFEDWTSSNHANNTQEEHVWTFESRTPKSMLSFDWAVSSEEGCDYLTVYLDGNQIINVSGEQKARYETEILQVGSHVLRAVYSKDVSVNNGSDQASITNIIAPSAIDCEKLLSYSSAVVGTIVGFDAVIVELQASVEEVTKLFAEGNDVDLLEQKAEHLDSLCAMVIAIKNEYEKIYEDVALYKELAIVLADEDLSSAIKAAEAIIAAKATLTTGSLDSIVSARQAITQIVDGMNIVGTKVWDFNVCQATKDALYNDYNYWGNWGKNNDSYYTYTYSNSNWCQFCYQSTDGQTHNVPETEGIFFRAGGYRFDLYTDGTNRLRTNGYDSGYSFMIPNLTTGQELKINYTTTSNGSNCGISCNSNNTMLIDGLDRTTGTAEVTYRVIRDGDVIFYPYNRSIYINSISLTVPGDPIILAELRKEVADYIATSNALPGLKSELRTAYDNAVVGHDAEKVDSVMTELRDVYYNVKNAVDIYPNLCADMDSASVVLADCAYVDVSEAFSLGQAIDVNTSASAEYFAAYDALETALAIYNSSLVAKSNWSFNTTVITVDGLRYYLDTTNKLAEFINFSSSNAYSGALNIPATIRYNGTTYAVVAMINNGRYSQSNITSVTLPKTLRYIGDYGLGYFSNVRSIEIPENVTSMGSYVFSSSSNLTSIKINAVVPPTISSMSGSSYKKITIPVESFHAYRIANVWKDNILIGGDGVTVSTGKIVAGDLGHIVLDEATYLQEVNKLIIDEGTLNNDDWNTIKTMTNLVEIDMSGVTMASLPANAFDGRWAIEDIKLPYNVTSIGNYALRGTGIKEVILPETITTLGTYAFSNCDSIRTISIPKAIITIPSYCFNDCDNLQKVELPNGLTSINQYAFYSCDKLSESNLPSSVTSIGSYAFRYCPIKTIAIPSGITAINSYSFADNSAIDSLFVPETVTVINSNAFYNCTSLKDVKFCEGLVNLYGNAFYGCKKLTEIILPSSLEKCESAPFYGCSGIKKVEARSVIPPTTGGSCPLSNVSLNDVILYVPSWSTSEYPLADGWSSFYTVDVSDFMPQYIKVNKDFYFTVRDTISSDYRPNISMTYSSVESTDAYGHSNYERGNLTISGRSKLAVNDFNIVVSPYAKYYSDENVRSNYNYDNYRTRLNSTSLIVNGEMRAENVTMSLCNYDSRWQFVTFPFDVKVSDIVPQSENTSWVIRGHNSAMRAAGKADSVWVNLTADDVLEAGKGYIMHNYNPNSFSYNGSSFDCSWFDVKPLTTTVNRQLIFSSEDRTIELEENLAEFDHNRSWNLIGNPYPCFYDSRFMDFDAPFMVWNSYNQNYVAYNPADDAYILSPGEAFFVQRPFEQESITFRKDGRQTHRYAREMTLEAPARTKVVSNKARTIYNLILQQDTLIDRTRVVFNEAASLAYEMNRDAAKFASSEKNVPQIFTVADKTQYAINERPFATGDVALGVYCGVEGEFTISLDQTYGCKVILEDKLANVFVELSADNIYTFSAFAGEYLTRFVLHFENEATGVDDINMDNVITGDAIYNLQGIKVNNTNNKGIYIKNGQKTIIK